MKNRRATFKYDAQVLKNGYEAMAKINLGYAEAAIKGDAKDFMSYEQVLKDTWIGKDDD